jgi:hypothetical protein
VTAWFTACGTEHRFVNVAQCGFWGNAITEQTALLAAPELLGIHTNMPATIPGDIAKALPSPSDRRPRKPTDADVTD